MAQIKTKLLLLPHAHYRLINFQSADPIHFLPEQIIIQRQTQHPFGYISSNFKMFSQLIQRLLGVWGLAVLCSRHCEDGDSRMWQSVVF